MADEITKETASAVAYENGSSSFEPSSIGRWERFRDGFKPAHYDDEEYAGLSAVERSARATANSPLARKLKNRHVQMIAIGGSIGTGLFIGTGSSLSQGGPASVLISFLVVGSALYVTVQALGELGTNFPVAGSFSTYATRFLDPAWGFAMGTNYALQWLAALPLELLAASICAQFWNPSLNPASIVIIFWLFIAVVCIAGSSRVYGEAEFILSIIKVIAVIGFIILGIVIACGGSPNGQGYLGGKYWHDPGAFANGFKGFAACFVASSFSFSGTELVGLAAAEMSNPRKDLPRACKQIFIRILLFYVVTIIVIGCLVPYTSPRLIGSGAVIDVKVSPFVIAIQDAGIKGLPSVFNAVVLLSVISVGNSSVYASSRTIAALAAQGQLPKIFGYIDREGRPMTGILVTLLFGLICFVGAAGQSVQTQVFNWLMAISGLSAIFTWGSCCCAHLAFRRALKVQGRDTSELLYKAQSGVWGSWYGVIMMIFILGIQFWIALFPLGGPPSAQGFFEIYLAFPLAGVCYIGYKLWYKTRFVRSSELDVDTGRRVVDIDVLQAEIAQEKAEMADRSFWYKFYRFWC